MKLIRVRKCDGECCRESPRFPNAEHTDCKYHVNNGCDLMRKPELIPSGMCPAIPQLTASDGFIQSCLQWPHKSEVNDTGNCCWQWAD